MSAPPAPRTLADQFRSWSDERLAALVEARPDLAVPAPTDSAQLASRAVVRVSVARALDKLDRLQLETLLATVQLCAEGSTSSTIVESVLHAAPASVRTALDRLSELALIWGSHDAWRPTTVVAELVGIPPGPEPGVAARSLDAIDPRSRAILDHLDLTDAAGTVADARRTVRLAEAETPTEVLLAHRLLAPRDDRHLVVPWSVRLLLRDGRSTREPIDVPPALAETSRDAAMVDRAAAGAAYEFARRTEMLLESWSSKPPAGLRTGGLGVRDLRAAAELVHEEPSGTALIIETAAAANLIAVGMNDDLDAAWLPTDAYDTWAALPTAERWEVLAHAWLENHRLVSAIGGRDGDRPINALSPGLERSWLPGDRTSTVAILLDLTNGQVLAAGTGTGSLVERLRWKHPRRPQARLTHAASTLDEASAIGLVGLNGLSSFGRELLSQGPNTTSKLSVLLPTPVDHVLIQADLTAVAPGPLEQDFARKLGLLADVESRGGATTYRFTVASVRRGFDAGWSAQEVKSFLATSSRTPVPQALEYLVDDVARRFGTLRVGTAESFLRSDDETALTELLHNQAAASLRLRRIAPTVVISDVPLQVLLPRLRELGAAPVVEAADGTVRIARSEEHRSRTPRPAPSAGLSEARQAARTVAVVAAIRAGDRAAAQRPSQAPARSPADVMSALRGAAEDSAEVWISYLDNHGTAVERVVRPVTVGGGQLSAYDERTDEVRSFAIHRISEVRRPSA
jgi:hypothetical protein